MDPVKPELVRAVGDLPLLTLSLLVIFGQFLLTLRLAKETLKEVRQVTLALTKVLLRFEDWMRKHDKE